MSEIERGTERDTHRRTYCYNCMITSMKPKDSRKPCNTNGKNKAEADKVTNRTCPAIAFSCGYI